MRDAQGLDRLLRAVQELSMTRTVEGVVAIVRTAARDLTGCDGATFVLCEDDMCHYVDEDAISPLWSGQRFPLETCISGWTMLNKQAAVIEDIYADDRIPHDAYRPTFVKSLVMVPIRDAAPIGTIGNYWSTRHQATEHEVHLLQALANATSIALENVALHEELAESQQRAKTDELTGLLTRRGLVLVGEATLQASRTANVNCMLAFIDLDGLKRVNDSHGHAAGDDLIRAAARALRSFVREQDIVARLGGDEFVVMATDVRHAGERIRERCDEVFSEHGVSASIGWIEVGPESNLSVVQMIELADARMYRDKQSRHAASPELDRSLRALAVHDELRA